MKKTLAELEEIYGTENIASDNEIESMRAVLLDEVTSLPSHLVMFEFEALMRTRERQERDERAAAKRREREARRAAREKGAS